LVCILGMPAFIALAAAHVGAASDAFRVTGRVRHSPPWLTTWPMATVGAAAAGFVVFQICIDVYRVPSTSMEPTIHMRTTILVDALRIHWRAPERGEVIVLEYPCDPKRTYVKRVIALGGDSVEVRCGTVYVNGAALASELVKENDTYAEEYGGQWSAR